jgi:hypothetical protein
VKTAKLMTHTIDIREYRDGGNRWTTRCRLRKDVIIDAEGAGTSLAKQDTSVVLSVDVYRGFR